MNNKGEIKDKKSKYYEKDNIFHIIKDGWDVLSSEFDIIVNNAKSFNDTLDENRKKNFKSIIASLEKFKDNFKNVISLKKIFSTKFKNKIIKLKFK